VPGDDLVIESEERGNGTECEPSGHHQRVVRSGRAVVLVHPNGRYTVAALLSDFARNRTSKVTGAAISACTETNEPARMK